MYLGAPFLVILINVYHLNYIFIPISVACLWAYKYLEKKDFFTQFSKVPYPRYCHIHFATLTCLMN